jgi:hypothetical protein
MGIRKIYRTLPETFPILKNTAYSSNKVINGVCFRLYPVFAIYKKIPLWTMEALMGRGFRGHDRRSHEHGVIQRQANIPWIEKYIAGSQPGCGLEGI